MKKCGHCSKVKSFSEFYKPHHNWCIACSKEYSRVFQRNNKDKRRAYEIRNKDRISSWKKQYKTARRDIDRELERKRRRKSAAEERAFRNLLPPATHKWCRDCGEIKQITQFGLNRLRNPKGHCKLCGNERARVQRQRRPELVTAMRRRQLEKHRAKVNAYNKAAKLRRRKQAVVPWADKDKIAAFYALATLLTSQTGIKHEVDHIIPVKHPLVCGLHVETNLRVVTRSENAKKWNKFEIAGY